jgi:uncharacterized protein (UPF0548 family)
LAPLTYAEVGATLQGPLPAGYRHLSRSAVGVGIDLERAAERLMGWEVHRSAGLRVGPSTPRAAVGLDVEMRLLGLRVPCQVVAVVDEPGRVGFAYGTLPGHPECGEELFLLEDVHRGVRATVTAFSRPATPLARAAGPLGRLLQDRMTDRYLWAMTAAG